MIDINNPLLKAYNDKLNNAILMPGSSSVFVKAYEGEEPDNVQDAYYIVFGSVNSTDNSTKQCAGYITSIQVGVYGWALKYGGNARRNTNDIAGQVLTLISPNPVNTMQAGGIGIIGTKIQSDKEQNIGSLAGRKFCNRILIFSHYIYT